MSLVFTTLVWALVGYASFGLLFSLPFLMWGLIKVDPDTQGSSIWFRCLLIPGTIAFWPILLRTWLSKHS